MNIVATIEARMGSTRLPGKTLAPIMGRPMLELLIERLRRVPSLTGIAVATTSAPEDDAIEQLARRLEVGCYRGSADDVLDRVLRCAQMQRADLIVEITGDCPLIDPIQTELVIHTFRHGQFDYVANNVVRSLPRGLDTQIFPTAVLAEVATLTNDAADREHVSLYIYEHPERYRIHNILAPARLHRPNLRLTVDTPEDLALARAIYETLYPAKPDFDTYDILNLLESRPELIANADIRQKPVRAG